MIHTVEYCWYAMWFRPQLRESMGREVWLRELKIVKILTIY